jgi:hypothetical protein
MANDLFKPEPARKKAERIWRNHDVATRFKKLKSPDCDPGTSPTEDEFQFYDGKKYFATEVPKPPSELIARTITPSDEDIETIAQQRQKRDRRLYKFLADMVRIGRSTITLTGPELIGIEREKRLAAYKAELARRKRRLMLERLRRLENGTYGR